MSDSPFSSLSDLPCDVAEALEQFKLAIIRHRSMKWEMFSQDEMKSVCHALAQFVHGDESTTVQVSPQTCETSPCPFGCDGSLLVMNSIKASTGGIRLAARELIDKLELLELAQALTDDDPLDSYEPYIEWLASHDRGDLYLRQAVERLLDKLHVMRKSEEIHAILQLAAKYMKPRS